MAGAIDLALDRPARWLSSNTNLNEVHAQPPIEVPVMLSVVKIVNNTRGWYEAV